MFEGLRVTFRALAMLLALAAPLAGQETPGASDRSAAAVAVSQRLTTLLAGLPQGTQVGLVVADTRDGTAWFAHQPRLPLKPASVLKLFVTAAALQRFGPDFTYETRLYLHNDELLLLGSGNPGLGDQRIAHRHGRPVHGELEHWARQLTERGIGTLQTIALDDSVFDQQYRHPDWPDDQAQAWYQAPVGGINFNDNCLDARLTITGGKLNLILQPDLPESFFRNALRVASKHAPVATRAMDQDVFQFSGTVAHDEQLSPISAARPSVFFGHALKNALAKRGIALPGHVVRRRISPATLDDAELLDIRTTPLVDVLWRCNTFSQNLFAECLLKSLAAYDVGGTRSGATGSWSGGIAVLEATLQELGIDLEGAVFRDGSGLSHRNRVTAEQVVQLLLAMRRYPHGEIFIESLAEAGKDGTMRRHCATPTLEGRLRGKTGTIYQVHALAGYLERPDKTMLAFGLLVNGPAPRSLPVSVAEALVGVGPSAPR